MRGDRGQRVGLGPEAQAALRDGLKALPVPEVSAGFDARIHAALRKAEPFWHPVWAGMRPAVSAAICSLLLTLALLKVLTAPGSVSANRPSDAGARVVVAVGGLARTIGGDVASIAP